MLLRLFPQNKTRNVLDSRISPALDYVLGNVDSKGEDREFAPKVLCGDPDLLGMQLAYALSSAPYVSGAINFTEEFGQLSSETVHHIIGSTQELMYPGFLPYKPHSVFILHRKAGDKGFEIHFIGICNDPKTGAAITPLITMRDGKRLRTWCQFINLSCGLTSPFEPDRLRLMSIPKGHRNTSKRSIYEQIHQQVLAEVEGKRIGCRADVIRLLEKKGRQAQVFAADPTRDYDKEKIRVVIDNKPYDFGGFVYSAEFSSSEVLEKYRRQVEFDNRCMQDRDWMYRCAMTLMLRRAADNLAKLRNDSSLLFKLPPAPAVDLGLSDFQCIDPFAPEWVNEIKRFFPSTSKIYETPQRILSPAYQHAERHDPTPGGPAEPSRNIEKRATPRPGGQQDVPDGKQDHGSGSGDGGDQDKSNPSHKAAFGMDPDWSWFGKLFRRIADTASELRKALQGGRGLGDRFEGIAQTLGKILTRRRQIIKTTPVKKNAKAKKTGKKQTDQDMEM